MWHLCDIWVVIASFPSIAIPSDRLCFPLERVRRDGYAGRRSQLLCWDRSQLGLAILAMDTAPHCTCFHFLPCWICSYSSHTQPTWVGIWGQSLRCWISLCGTCIPCLAPNSQARAALRAAAAQSLRYFLFIHSACKIESILSWKVLSCHWSEAAEHITRRQSCGARVFELVKFFSKVWISKGRRRRQLRYI